MAIFDPRVTSPIKTREQRVKLTGGKVDVFEEDYLRAASGIKQRIDDAVVVSFDIAMKNVDIIGDDVGHAAAFDRNGSDASVNVRNVLAMLENILEME